MSELLKWLGDSGVATFVTGLLSVGALIVSIIAIVTSHRAAKKSNEVQEEMLQIEQSREEDRIYDKKKAYLTAHIVAEPYTQRSATVMRHTLRIENKGLCEARGIKVVLDGKSVMDYAKFTAEQKKKEITQIGPLSYIDYPLGWGLNVVKPHDAYITWQDDSGERGHYRTSLT